MLIQYFGGYHSAFMFGALIDFAGVLAMLVFIRSRPQISAAVAAHSPN
jgi:hypothetical protein